MSASVPLKVPSERFDSDDGARFFVTSMTSAKAELTTEEQGRKIKELENAGDRLEGSPLVDHH